jgi:hypothetical protein
MRLQALALTLALLSTACGGASSAPDQADQPVESGSSEGGEASQATDEARNDAWVDPMQGPDLQHSIAELCGKVAQINARGGWPDLGDEPLPVVRVELTNRSRRDVDIAAWRLALEEALVEQGVVSLAVPGDPRVVHVLLGGELSGGAPRAGEGATTYDYTISYRLIGTDGVMIQPGMVTTRFRRVISD